MWPEQDQCTTGPTTIDISLVNGFNVGVSLTPDRDTVCSIADTEGGVPHFVLYKAGIPMAVFPKDPNATIHDICPAGTMTPMDQVEKYGCYSACSYANYTNDSNKDQICCAGDYHSVSACTEPPTLPWVKSIDENSTRVYSWAFDDWRGTFTWEPTAKFTFTLTYPFDFD